MILDNYSTKKATICFLGQISDILCYFGLNISEAWLLGSSSKLEFCFGYTDLINKDKWRCKDDSCRIYLYCVDIFYEYSKYKMCLNQLNIDFKTHFYKKTIDLSYITTIIDKGIPIILKVDTFFLPYHSNFQKYHEIHNIVLFGIDNKNNKAFIADNHITTLKVSNYIGPIPYSNFKNAIDLEYCGTFFKHMFWELSPKEDKQLVIPDYQNTLMNSIKESNFEMLQKKSVINKRYFGIEGIRALQGELVNFSQISINNKEWKNVKLIHTYISGYAGPIAARHLYLQYLIEETHRGTIRKENAKEIVRNFEVLINEWRIIANVVLKSYLLKKNDKLKTAAIRMNFIIELELKIISEMNVILKNLF